MRTINLALAIHNHQPVGNFDFVFAEAYQRAYLPMIELLERHRAVRLALHYTGPLRDWLAAHQPDLLRRIRALAARGQIEMMTGGYYEPILAAIPDADKRGQIEKLTRAVKKDFGYDARGLWLAERVWEPSLAKPIAEAGVEYTVVDDTHFKYVGLDDKDLFGYYVTEEQGAMLKIFGTSKHLRYTIPWASVEETIAWLREQATEDGTRVAVMGDDGEKFGLWPGTYEHCWGAQDQSPVASRQSPVSNPGWMENFFRALEENKEWLHTTTLAEYAEKFPALGRIYLPTASYDEMSEWALPAQLSHDLTRVKHELQAEKRDDVLRFIRGAFWRNFLVKYPEVNAMHKKMLLVSEKVNSQQSTVNSKKRLSSLHSPLATDHLYAGQCNCPYWHGVFGGIYLPHIRHANYAHLIQAENIADEIVHEKKDWVDFELRDYDKDSHAELLVSGSAMNLYFDLARGGAITEWDWRAKKFNLVNTLSRREEGYHRDLVEAAERDTVEFPGRAGKKIESIHSSVVRAKEPGLENLLSYDWYRRAGLIDHFIPFETTLDDFAAARYRELGDFVDQAYKPQVARRKSQVVVTLTRDGHIWQEKDFVPVRVEKQLIVQIPNPKSKSPTLAPQASAGVSNLQLPINYSITNLGQQEISARFGVEFCFGLLAGHSDDAFYRAEGIGKENRWLDSSGEIETERIALVNEYLGLEIALGLRTPSRLWRMPVETISLSEAGFERVYQASCIVPLWDIALKPGEKWQTSFEFELNAAQGHVNAVWQFGNFLTVC